MAKRQNKKKIDTTGNQDDGFGHNPFADFFGKDTDPPKPETAQAASKQPSPPAAQAQRGSTSGLPKKVLLRFTRKGRGGKSVTLVTGFEEFSQAEQNAWAKKMKQAMGCGASLDDDGTIVIQGDQRPRLSAWLEKQGIDKVQTT